MNFLGSIRDRAKRAVTTVAGGAVELVGDPSIVIQKATGILEKANKESRKGLFEQVLKQLSDLINFLDLDLLLKVAKKLTKFALVTVIERVGSLPSIREGIFSNDINAATLTLIMDQAGGLVDFLLDIVEAAKCYALANSETGIATPNDARGEFNEFDFSDPMNRHAIICQIQRLVKSILFILRGVDRPNNFVDIDMTKETILPSDFGIQLGGTLNDTPESEPPSEGSQPSPPPSPHGQQGEETLSEEVPKEKWLFINGIAGELYWLRLACNKLKATFSRDVTGIFNRGDGLLWDIIECAGQRSPYVQQPNGQGPQGSPNAEAIVESQRNLIQKTSSSKQAQKTLSGELRRALEAVSDAPNAYVVIVAHSQGCLILRHVLEDLITGADPTEIEDADLLKLREKMREQLCVFTFGNPSLHWLTRSPNEANGLENPTYLSSYVRRTEHFANSRDFVAKLGVLSDDIPASSGYGEAEVFINRRRDWVGHLFGTQYSLDPAHYENPNGENSWLLACRDAVSMEEVRQSVSPQG